MFEFLKLFDSSNIFSTGSTIFNTYAHLRANRERVDSGIRDLKYKARKLELDVEFDNKTTQEAVKEYADICSYKIDELRKEQLQNRQVLGYNILKSGIAITSEDTAGILLRMQAQTDEMRARSIEAQMYHNRPKIKINPKALDLAKEYTRTQISDLNSTIPWSNAATILGGISQLSRLANE